MFKLRLFTEYNYINFECHHPPNVWRCPPPALKSHISIKIVSKYPGFKGLKYFTFALLQTFLCTERIFIVKWSSHTWFSFFLLDVSRRIEIHIYNWTWSKILFWTWTQTNPDSRYETITEQKLKLRPLTAHPSSIFIF